MPAHTGGESIISPPQLHDSKALHTALIERAPTWAMCGDAPHFAALEESRKPAEQALKQRYCQLNPRNRLGVIIVDLDHCDGSLWNDAPPPTYSTLNPKSGHQQAGYILAQPVSRGGQARLGPQRLADDVCDALTRELHGDPQYGGLLARGPYHPDHITRLVSGRIWTLTELLQELPPMPSLTRRALLKAAEKAELEGRNCAAFEALRHVAYALHNRGMSGQRLLDGVWAEAHRLNSTLPDRELASVVRSICLWVDRRHNPTSSEGSARSRIHSANRDKLTEAQAIANMRQGQAKGKANQREATSARLRMAEVQLQATGRIITALALAELAEVSNKTALAYLRSQAEG